MITTGPDGNRRKAVPTTQSLIFRSLLAGLIGVIVLALGVQRLLPLENFTLGGFAMPLVGLILLGVALFGARDLPAARKLDTQGEVGPGKIVARWTKRDSEGDRDCFLAYSYGEGQEAYQKVGWKHYRQIEVGAVVSVRYVPEEPQLSRLDGEWFLSMSRLQ